MKTIILRTVSGKEYSTADGYSIHISYYNGNKDMMKMDKSSLGTYQSRPDTLYAVTYNSEITHINGIMIESITIK